MNQYLLNVWMHEFVQRTNFFFNFLNAYVQAKPDVIYTSRCNLLKKVKGNTSSSSKKVLPYLHICKLPCAIVLIRILNFKLKGTGNGRNFISVCQLKYVSIARKNKLKMNFHCYHLLSLINFCSEQRSLIMFKIQKVCNFKFKFNLWFSQQILNTSFIGISYSKVDH